MCPKRVMNQSTASYNLVFQDSSERPAKCQADLFRATAPVRGCDNIWSTLSKSGVLYFERVSILPNVNWVIEGNWSLAALTITTQFKSILARRWLTVVAPNAAKSKSAMMKTFPSFPAHTLMQIPIKYGYLLSNFMSHVAYLQQFCFKRDSKKQFAPFCVVNPRLCPCEEIGVATVDFVFPVMV